MNLTNTSRQLNDDPGLLDLMLEDSRNADPIYRPTQYWQFQEDLQAPTLRSNGLRDIRHSPQNIFKGFGGTDRYPSFFSVFGPLRNNLQSSPEFENLNGLLNQLIEEWPEEKWLPYELSLRNIREAAYRLAKYYGLSRQARSIDNLQSSLAGNPSDVFTIDGRPYTYRDLYYYMKYAYCAPFVDFDAMNIMVELGAGMGRQCEVIKKLHPDITYLIFDLPTQLYVCGQYLEDVFPDNLVMYRECREMTDLTALKKATYICSETGSSRSCVETTSTSFGTAKVFRRWSPKWSPITRPS